MNLGLNWVDWAIMLTLGLFAWEAFGHSLIVELIDLASFLLAFFLSFSFYNYPAKFFASQFSVAHGFSLVLGYMATWFLAEIIFYIVVRMIFPKIPQLKIPYEKLLAMIPSFLKGIIFVSLFLVLLATFPIQPQIKRSVQESKIGSFMLKYTYLLEGPVKNVFGGISQDSLSFLTIHPKTNERVDLGFKTSDYKIDESSEQAMIELVNKERISRGLHSLIFDGKLRKVARVHSADMFKRGYFSHYSPEGESVADRANRAEVDYLVIGENLAYSPTLELAHQGLMNSEGHRANILSPDFHKIGVGVMDGGVYGRMFTQVFTN